MALEDLKKLNEMTGAGLLDCKKALAEAGGNLDQAVQLIRERGLAKVAKKAARIAAEGLVSIALDGNRAALVEVNCETDFVAKNDLFKAFVNQVAEAALSLNITDPETLMNGKTSEGTFHDTLAALTARIGEKISLRRIVIVEKQAGEVFGNYIHGGRIGAIVVLTGTNSEVAKDVAMQVAACDPQYIDTTDIPADRYEAERKTQLAILDSEGGSNKPQNIIDMIIKGRTEKALFEQVLLQQPFIKDPQQQVHAVLGASKIITMVRFAVGEGIEKRQDDFAAEVRRQAGQ